MRCCIWVIAVVACPRETPGARVNVIVTEGKKEEWFTLSGEVAAVAVLKARKGTELFPLA